MVDNTGGESFLRRAHEFISERKTQASEYKRNAFARAVLALVEGVPPGLAGGPTVREHAILRQYGGTHHTFEEAVAILVGDDGPIFGPLTDIHRQVWEEEFCFDDDPEDCDQMTDWG